MTNKIYKEVEGLIRVYNPLIKDRKIILTDVFATLRLLSKYEDYDFIFNADGFIEVISVLDKTNDFQHKVVFWNVLKPYLDEQDDDVFIFLLEKLKRLNEYHKK